MKNRIFAIFILLMLVSPVYSLPENAEKSIPEQEMAVETELGSYEQETKTVDGTNLTEETDAAEGVLQPEDSVLNKELAATPYKQPISKRKLAKKFLLAMMGVAGSSLIIFAGLSIYNRVRENVISTNQMYERESGTSLDTPDNLTDAVRSFMDKTRWN